MALLPKVQEKLPQVEGVLLLCAVVEKDGHSWGHTSITSKLLGPGGWQEVSSGRASSRIGRAIANFDLVTLWEKLEWFRHPSGSSTKVGLLKTFLESLKLPGGNAGKRAAGHAVHLLPQRRLWPPVRDAARSHAIISRVFAPR